MARRLGWWSFVLLVSSVVLSHRTIAQSQPAKAHSQRTKPQAQPANTQAQPGGTQAQHGAQAQPGAAPAQPAATAQPASGQAQPAAGETQPVGAQAQSAASVQALKITSVEVFQVAGTPQGQATFYLEITGESFPVTNPIIFLAPPLKTQPKVISANDTTIVAKFTADASYFPDTVGVASTGGAIDTTKVDANANIHSKLPRIDDIEVLQLNRVNGSGSLKIDGTNFGTDPNKISVTIVPREPGLPAFAPVTPPDPYTCPTPVKGQEATAPTVRSGAKNDVIIVDFSFFCESGYSVPFVIARVVLNVTDEDGHQASASYEMQPARDPNLTYRSTILSQKQTSSQFGGGIAKNFYAVQLSIVNRGSGKVQVPLASIRAEVEWFAGTAKLYRNGSVEKYYREGPATVAPVPLTGAVSYFSTHRQATGARAIFFNTLQGLTTIGSAIQLFFGPGFAQGVGIAGGGFRQGLGQIFQDLSDQQLANLTSQSFESIETVSGNGGSIEKVIFIQRREERLESGDTRTKFRRLIDNIVGFEITGYEVPATPAKSATPQR